LIVWNSQICHEKSDRLFLSIEDAEKVEESIQQEEQDDPRKKKKFKLGAKFCAVFIILFFIFSIQNHEWWLSSQDKESSNLQELSSRTFHKSLGMTKNLLEC
jgi:uncharacterized ion transporter superfamily protein YfcC